MATLRDPKVTSRIMAAVRDRDTRPEIILRSQLWKLGLRYRKTSYLPGKPDIVFAASRLVVFVDGDFWHGHSWKLRGYSSFEEQFNHRNADFWREKIERNIARDREVNRLLRHAGWSVVRVWESDILKDPARVAVRIARKIRKRGRV